MYTADRFFSKKKKRSRKTRANSLCVVISATTVDRVNKTFVETRPQSAAKPRGRGACPNPRPSCTV